MENTNLLTQKPPVNRGVRKSDDPLRARMNKHFIIRWKLKGVPGSHLISAGQYEKLIANTTTLEPLPTKLEHFDRALNCGEQRFTIVTRQNLIITFISK